MVKVNNKGAHVFSFVIFNAVKLIYLKIAGMDVARGSLSLTKVAS